MQVTSKTFNKHFRFTVCISIFYELLHICHATAILQVLGLESYGLLGSLLSIIHLGTHLADWGMTNSITPYLQLFLQSKQHWRKLFFQYTLVPHFPLIILTGFLSIFFVKATTLIISPLVLALLLLLIILETIQAFMRQLLYALFKTISVAMTEVGLLATRILFLWVLHFCTNMHISLELIIWSHLVNTVICLALFSITLLKVYQALPETCQKPFINPGWRLLVNRLNNYFLRLTRNIFTTQFITPLFAIQFGLKTAGLFFIASKLAKTVQAAVKLSIGYSGNGLLAQVKDQPLSIKRDTFALLSNKLCSLIIPACMLFIPLSIGALQTHYLSNISAQVLILSLLFLLITFFEFFFMLYEQWYILEEASQRLFLVKILELGILFFLIRFFIFAPIHFLSTLIILRIIHFGFIAITAYKRWGIKLCYTINSFGYALYAGLTLISFYFLHNTIF